MTVLVVSSQMYKCGVRTITTLSYERNGGCTNQTTPKTSRQFIRDVCFSDARALQPVRDMRLRVLVLQPMDVPQSGGATCGAITRLTFGGPENFQGFGVFPPHF